MIKKFIFPLLSIVVLLTGCDFGAQQRQAKLQHKIDSLYFELEASNQMAISLQEIGVLLDSIDASRNVLRTSMMEGVTYDEYVLRVEDIHNYVKNAERKISQLEQSAKTSKANTGYLTASLQKIKTELNSRNEELAVLQRQLGEYKGENAILVKTVEDLDLQKSELTKKINQMEALQIETDTLKQRITVMQKQTFTEAGEAYYLRAQAVEMTASRTKFAPRKKQETRKEALELYRMAALYGNEKAESKMTELQGKIKGGQQ